MSIKLTLIKSLLPFNFFFNKRSPKKQYYKKVGIPSDSKVRKTREYMKSSALEMDKNVVQS